MAEILMVVAIVLLGVVVVSVLQNITESVHETEEPKQKIKCKLHDWVTDEQTEKLICCRCGKIAGIITEDEIDE